MKSTNTCPKCHSTDIIPDVETIDRQHGGGQPEMTLATFRNPDALIFKQKQTTTVSAWVCASCGFIEFYADTPAAIRLPKKSDPRPISPPPPTHSEF